MYYAIQVSTLRDMHVCTFHVEAACSPPNIAAPQTRPLNRSRRTHPVSWGEPTQVLIFFAMALRLASSTWS